jgi:hypothetical protein
MGTMENDFEFWALTKEEGVELYGDNLIVMLSTCITGKKTVYRLNARCLGNDDNWHQSSSHHFDSLCMVNLH